MSRRRRTPEAVGPGPGESGRPHPLERPVRGADGGSLLTLPSASATAGYAPETRHAPSTMNLNRYVPVGRTHAHACVAGESSGGGTRAADPSSLASARISGPFVGGVVRSSVRARVVGIDPRHGDLVRPPSGDVAREHHVLAAAAQTKVTRWSLTRRRGGALRRARSRLRRRGGFGEVRRRPKPKPRRRPKPRVHRAPQRSVRVDRVGEPLELDRVEARGEVREPRAASVVQVEVREFVHAEGPAEVLHVEVDLHEEHVLLLGRELAQARVQAAARVAPPGVELDDQERGRALVAARAHDVLSSSSERTSTKLAVAGASYQPSVRALPGEGADRPRRGRRAQGADARGRRGRHVGSGPGAATRAGASMERTGGRRRSAALYDTREFSLPS